MDINELNKQLQEALNKLKQFNEIYLYEMAQKQGSADKFIFYTLDNELYSHYPHVHICVSNNEKKWKGRPLKDGSLYKSIGSIKLLMLEDCLYTKTNLEYESIVDESILSPKYKKLFVEWLNTKTRGTFNSLRCLDSYLLSNNNFKWYKEYNEYLDRKTI